MFQQQKNLFRKAALEKLSSPEQLDILMRVTTPTGWLALAALGCALLVTVVWGIYGEIALKVDGNGILLRGEAVLDVTVSSSGRLAEIHVGPGDIVHQGEELASILQGSLEMQIEALQQRLGELEQQDVRQQRLESDNQQLSLQALAQEREGQEEAIRDGQRSVQELKEKIAVQTELVSKGLITENTLLITRQQLTQAEQGITRNQVRLAQISSESTALERQVIQQQNQRQNQMDEVRRQIHEAKMKLSTSSTVISPYAGRVLELMVDPGNLVGPGARLLTLEAVEQSIESVFFVPASEGKKIQPGMEVRISPSTVKVEEFGFILGEVKSVSEFPVTPEGLSRVLRNETLLKELTGGAAPIEVVARLSVDPETASGYRWSSSTGPPTEVFSGTLCSASVVVEVRHPIEYVLPKVKQALGLN